MDLGIYFGANSFSIPHTEGLKAGGNIEKLQSSVNVVKFILIQFSNKLKKAYLKGRVTKRVEETEGFQSLAHFPNSHNIWSWARLMVGLCADTGTVHQLPPHLLMFVKLQVDSGWLQATCVWAYKLLPTGVGHRDTSTNYTQWNPALIFLFLLSHDPLNLWSLFLWNAPQLPDLYSRTI